MQAQPSCSSGVCKVSGGVSSPELPLPPAVLQVERAIEKGQISVEEGTRRMVALLRQQQVHQGGAGAKRPPPPGFAAAAAAAATVPEAAAAAAVAAGVAVEDEPAGSGAGSGVGTGSGAGMGRTQLPWPASHFAVPPMASTSWTVRRLPLSGVLAAARVGKAGDLCL